MSRNFFNFLKFQFFLVIILFVQVGTVAQGAELFRESFNEVWKGASSNPYPFRPKTDPLFEESPQVLPQYIVGAERFKDPENWLNFTNVDLLIKAALRTMTTKKHLLNFGGPKLVHSNGACLGGEWHITRQAFMEPGFPFTGGFKKGAAGRVIARVSAATTPTIKNDPKHLVGTVYEGDRAFGLAVAIFFNPADITQIVDPNQPVTPDWIANAHTVHDLGGADEDFFTKVKLSNRPLLPGLRNIGDAGLLIQTKRGLQAGDKNSPITERQVYPISFVGVENVWHANTPYEMVFSGLEDRNADPVIKNRKQHVERDDLRDEVRPALREDGHLYLGIYVRSKLQKQLTYTGYMDFDKEHFSVSEGCDQKFHIPHAKWLR